MTQIAVIVKGEKKYFEHWASYHRERGFGPVTVYADEDDAMDYCASADKVIRNTHTHDARQVHCFNDFIQDHAEDKDGFVLFIDVDEYADFTAEEIEGVVGNSNVLVIPQVPYIAADDTYRWKYVDKPVTERFTKRGGCLIRQSGKCLVRLGAPVLMFTAHDVTQGTDPHTVKRTNKCKIRHYITKSEEEWNWRRFVRNDVHVNKYTDKDFDMYNELICT